MIYLGVINTNLVTEFTSVKNNLKCKTHLKVYTYACNSGDSSDKEHSNFMCF